MMFATVAPQLINKFKKNITEMTLWNTIDSLNTHYRFNEFALTFLKIQTVALK